VGVFFLFLDFCILPSKELVLGTSLRSDPILILILGGKWHCKKCDECFYFLVRNVLLVTHTRALALQ
jgi:hypothetical protein